MIAWGGAAAGSPITDDVGWPGPITPYPLIHLLGLLMISPNYYRNALAGEHSHAHARGASHMRMHIGMRAARETSFSETLFARRCHDGHRAALHSLA